MSSEIVGGDPSIATPAYWRTVATVRVEGWDDGQDEKARAAAEALERGRREGFEQGFASGRADAEKHILPAVANIAATLAQLTETREKLREQCLKDLVQLATLVAERVIHREVAVDPDALSGLIKVALAKVQSREVSRARVHPDLEPLVRRCLEQNGAAKRLDLQIDATLRPGDLIFETTQGALDASVDTQLREIERGLIDRLEG